MITLTQEERDKFARWLDQEADTDAGLYEQAKKLQLSEAVMAHMRVKVLSCRVVAKFLHGTENIILEVKS